MLSNFVSGSELLEREALVQPRRGQPRPAAGAGRTGRLDRGDRRGDGRVISAGGFDAWYQEQHPRVLAALTVASGSSDVAAEATDEAFVRAYERWERVRKMRSPGGWLYRVALNVMKRQHRRRAIERELLRRNRSQDSAPPPAVDPDLWAAVRELPQRQRTAVALRYVVDLTEAEVAKTMGVSRGAASASLTAARRHLGRVLGEAEARG